ncbi:MAG: S9 family peptidase [Calditrichaeota bacterium]|nr:S9 family peptidase [Calditrichota bacterium]
MKFKKFFPFLLLSSFVLVFFSFPSFSIDLKYQLPPKELVQIVDAPPTPSVNLSPNDEWMLILSRPNLPSIEEIAQPELRIAGIRINPRTNGPSHPRYYTNITLKNLKTMAETKIELPENSRITNIDWAPDNEKFTFTLTKKDKIELWLVEISSKRARKISEDFAVNDAYADAYFWLPNAKQLVCLTVPKKRLELSQKSEVPEGPVVQENIGKKAPARTYQDLLKNPYDEKLFEYFLTSQLMLFDLKGNAKPLGQPTIFSDVNPAPNGKYLLVSSVHRPYSYIVPVYRFPQKIEVWDLSAKPVFQVADIPLIEEIAIGFDAVRTGPRSVDWRSDAPATLCWIEAQDGGNPRAKVKIRDKVYSLAAPFHKTPTEIAALSLRFNGIFWENGKLALVNERWWRTRWSKTWIIQPDNPRAKPRLLFDRSYEDRYTDPGRPLFERNKMGHAVLKKKKNFIFFVGRGSSPQGDRPFLDALNLKTLKSVRLWRSKAPFYESPVTITDFKHHRMISRRESKTSPPNYFLHNWKNDQSVQLTNFPHPTPQLKNIQKEILTYTRSDGVQLTATLYLPEGYSPEQGRLPVFMWAYPREFKSKKAAGQMRGSPYRFIRVGWSSPAIWVTQGYAVLDGPTMPIIGEGDKEPNDTYVEQLVASAKAAVDELVKRGIADPKRIAIGGHSYGAFMTANLLAHSDLFAAGIARSGAYNRTLTPFGFQAEERTFWQAPEIYFKMSPFMHADKINEPILLIHGEADNNSGTFPLQSKRFYHALKGLGGTVRLVMLPHESHGYRARESVLHVLWEMNRWLDMYVKNR